MNELQNQKTSIAIIGGGLSGTLLVINLLRQPYSGSLELIWIDRNGDDILGPAYSTNEDYLLNVPVEKMSIYEKEPDHFLEWADNEGFDVHEGDYLPRKSFRKYVLDEYKKALNRKQNNRTVQRITDEAVNIHISERKTSVFTQHSGHFPADRVVLALGNALPKHLPGMTESCFKSSRYIRDPWDPELLEKIDQDDSIVFIGTGQTTVDLITGLNKRGHSGNLVSISRRGLLPMSHKHVDPYPSFYSEIDGETSILAIFRTVRKHLTIALEKGMDARAVIDSLRPYTVPLWMSLPAEEKERFLRHLFRYWERIRSRIPPVSMDVIQKLISSRQLTIIGGRIFNIDAYPEFLRVSFTDRKTYKNKSIKAHRVINCMGSNADISTIDQELIKNLLKKKLIRRAPSNLGMDALPEGDVLDISGNPSSILFTLGPAMKGVVWESIATPEIRLQAENLAIRILR